MKKIAALVLIALGGYVAFRSLGARDDDGGADLAFGRVWIEQLPRRDTDMVELLATVPDAEGGGFSKASQWKGDFEVFLYKGGGDGRAELTFPQSRDKEKVRFAARRCSERGFELCLELKGSSRGIKRYFSMNDWVVGSATLPASLGLPLAQIRAALHH